MTIKKIGSFLTVILIIITGVTFYPASANAQVAIAPTSLYIDDNNRFATMVVLNGSDQEQEISIDFEFGYLGADSLGNPRMIYDDETARQKYSIADKIRGFPQNFTIQPNERQTVRLTVRNMSDIDNGTYWTRVKTISNPLTPSVEQQADSGITARINFRFEQVMAAFYKKGDVTTGLNIKNITAHTNQDKSYLLCEMSQAGNSPFIGMATLRIKDKNGNTVFENRTSAAIYLDTMRKYKFNLNGEPAGTYTAELQFETTRQGIVASNLVQSENIVQTTTFDYKK